MDLHVNKVNTVLQMAHLEAASIIIIQTALSQTTDASS
jgi:protein subunit release factor B